MLTKLLLKACVNSLRHYFISIDLYYYPDNYNGKYTVRLSKYYAPDKPDYFRSNIGFVIPLIKCLYHICNNRI